MAGIRIDDLPNGMTANRNYLIPVMLGDVTYNLTVGQILDLIIGAAPGQLDTLDELAAAINDDAAFSATITALIGTANTNIAANTAAIAALTSGKQPIDSDLTAIAALTTTTFGRSLLTMADRLAALSALGVSPVARIAGFNSAPAVGDTLHDITFQPGVRIAREAGNLPIVLATALTKRFDASWVVGNNNGGMMTGQTLAANTWNHVYVIATAAGIVDIIGVPNGVALVLPAGYVWSGYIFSFLTESATAEIRQYIQIGDRVSWVVPIVAINLQPPTADALYNGRSPPIGKGVVGMGLYYQESAAAAATGLLVLDPDGATQVPTTTLFTMFMPAASGSGLMNSSAYIETGTDITGQFRVTLSRVDTDMTLRATAMNYTFHRGEVIT